jgi:plastocyanin
MTDDEAMRFDIARAAALTAAAVLALAGCSKSTPSDARPPSNPPPSTAAAPPAAAQSGVVSGSAAPGAIVVLEPKTPQAFPPGDQPVMDQVSLTFTPAMLFVRTGQPVEFRNSDDTLHNVHVGNADTKEPSFNVAIPTGEKFTYTFSKDGFYHVGCDIHPAMSADILAASTPFVTAAGANGSYGFENVPPGAYRVRVYAAGNRTENDVNVR